MQDSASSAAPSFRLQVKNASSSVWTFFLFQQLPDQGVGFESLAWLVGPPIPQNTTLTLEWTDELSFHWAQTGPLVVGNVFDSGGRVTAELNSANTTTFTVEPEPALSQPTAGSPDEGLIIRDDPSVPTATYSVATGLSGAPILAVQAGPGLTHFFDAPTTNFWLAGATEMTQGQVLPRVTSAQDLVQGSTWTSIAGISFPSGVTSVTATLDASLQWKVQED